MRSVTFVNDLLAGGCVIRDPAARGRPNTIPHLPQNRRRVCTRNDVNPKCAKASKGGIPYGLISSMVLRLL